MAYLGQKIHVSRKGISLLIDCVSGWCERDITEQQVQSIF